MRVGHVRAAMGGVLVLIATSACGQSPDNTVDQSGEKASEATVVSAKDFDRARFDVSSARITNQWFPLEPGTQYVYKGHAFDGGERLERKVISTVTDFTKVVAGVRARVLWDRDYDDGELIESELAFFAQDTDGNVWHLGQYPEEYEDGRLEKAPAWIEGAKGARAGLAMKAEPTQGPSYAQGFAPAPLFWDDRARVYKTGVSTCVPVDCYDNVLVMEEFEVRKPKAFQLKFYAPGVGGVRVGWRGAKEEEKETLKLVRLRQLGEEAMNEVRQDVLALEERAYEIKADVYGHTSPIEEAGTN
jgi:hypothetical protein